MRRWRRGVVMREGGVCWGEGGRELRGREEAWKIRYDLYMYIYMSVTASGPVHVTKDRGQEVIARLYRHCIRSIRVVRIQKGCSLRAKMFSSSVTC